MSADTAVTFRLTRPGRWQFPLPGGEGQGEGGRNSNICLYAITQPSQIANRKSKIKNEINPMKNHHTLPIRCLRSRRTILRIKPARSIADRKSKIKNSALSRWWLAQAAEQTPM